MSNGSGGTDEGFENIDDVDDRRVIGRRIVWHREVGSTMDEAHRAGAADEPEGLVIGADSQTRGRGRLQRRWLSTPGGALLLSVLLRPDNRLAPLVPVIAAVAVARTIDAFTMAGVSLKWPNDVLVAGRKIAGVIAEASYGPGGSYIALGLGLNVNLKPAAVPEISHLATSLREVNGEPASRSAVLRRLLKELDDVYAEARVGQAIIDEWRARLDTLGKRVSVLWADETLTGLAEDVDGDGRLLLRDPGGTLHTLSAGDVTVLPERQT
ncbi:MAG: biotin--[acetyl-CoA-carboxylase] ligase [Chloroflexota bacterium]